MKIDIHTHTKKVKQGDSEHRNIKLKSSQKSLKKLVLKF